jgi:hypothetical protein
MDCICSQVDFNKILTAVIPVVSVVVGWAINESSKRKDAIRKKREERYEIMLTSLSGFYESILPGISGESSKEDIEEKQKESESKKILKQAFLDQLNLSWIYCSDEVILKANEFLDSVKTQENNHLHSAQILGEFMLLVRKELGNCTNLQHSDFKINSPKKVYPKS